MLRNSIHSFISERKHYFATGASEINEVNLRMLVEASFTTTVLTLFFVFLTPFIVKGWEPSIWHLLLGPVAAVIFMCSLYYRHKKKKTAWVINVACMCFIACIFTFVIAIDVLMTPTEPSSFMQMFLMVVPCLFIFRYHVLYTEMLIFEVIYLVLVMKIKPVNMAQNDCFNSLVGMVASVFVSIIIQRLRAEAYNLQDRYKHLSMTDGLTGMMNKVNCEHAVRNVLQKRERQDGCALLIMDVDNFKKVNDTRGHKIGDEVLSAMGNVLLQTFRSTDMMGRIGGDEFMIFMRNVADIEGVEHKCKNLLENVNTMSERFDFGLSCSVGAVYLKGRSVTYEQLFQAADDVMYEVKTSGKAHYLIRKLKPQGKKTSEKPLLLIADDSELNRDILKESLKEEYEVLQAESGTDAVDYINIYQKKLAIILLDLYMPEMDGYQILKYMQERSNIRNIPVIVITADNKSEKEVLMMGAVDMIAKPFDNEVVQLRVRNAVRRAEEQKN